MPWAGGTGTREQGYTQSARRSAQSKLKSGGDSQILFGLYQFRGFRFYDH